MKKIQFILLKSSFTQSQTLAIFFPTQTLYRAFLLFSVFVQWMGPSKSALKLALNDGLPSSPVWEGISLISGQIKISINEEK